MQISNPLPTQATVQGHPINLHPKNILRTQSFKCLIRDLSILHKYFAENIVRVSFKQIYF